MKQFAYHKAFLSFIKEFGFRNVVNAFLVPKESSDNSPQKFARVGEACLDLMQIQNYAFKEKLPPIQVVELSPDFVYENYLSASKITDKLETLVENDKSGCEKDFENRKYLQVAETPLNKDAQISRKPNTDVNYNIIHKF